MNTLVIFGATGDLTQRKLLPALWNGFHHQRIANTKIIGVGRREWNDEKFRKLAKEWCNANESEKWGKFEENLCYHKMDFNNAKAYETLSQEVKESANIVYFLATPPEAFPIIARHASEVKKSATIRLVVEKPFGRDLKTAEKLNKQVKKYFGDEVYRIDHYLGKNIIRNILTLRFSNEVFKSVWNKKHVERVEISHAETIGVESRAAYYDSTGALRDMLQSHLLQMLALIAMEKPRDSTSLSVYKKKKELLKSLVVPDKGEILLGQYEGYKHDVGKKSDTETFVALKLNLKHPQWRGVPFYLVHGKKLDQRLAKITIKFKKPGFTNEEVPDKLCITVEPQEDISFTFNIRGADLKMKQFKMSYCESCEAPNTPQAYEKLLIDVFNGDKTLFTSWDEIRATWKFTDKIIETMKNEPRYTYTPGSKGPKEAIEKGLIPA